MKLFMVIYFAGQIGGTVGPLPYGIEECRTRAADIMSNAKQDVVTPEGYTARDVKFECEFHRERPANER